MYSDEINALLEAVKASPDNLPLRKLLAKKFLDSGRPNDAEIEYLQAIKMDSNDVGLKIGLAKAFQRQNKFSAGLVLLEDTLEYNQKVPAELYLVYAQLLLANDQGAEAIDAYEKARLIDPSLQDDDLEEELNKSETSKAREPRKATLGGPTDYDEEEDEEDAEKLAEVERPKINFSDIGGLEKLKEEIRLKIIHPLKHPEIYEAYGKKIGGGILMYGPPGCGKTMMARATAGEVNARFINVGINDILDMYIGNSERNLHSIFQLARRYAPSVLFFDEVDALGADRTDMRQHGGRHLINQFLSELDGVEYSNEGVLILAATNAPWHLDPAFRRPGRFDRLLFVPPPDQDSREAIFKVQLEGKPQEKINYKELSKKTGEFSGADIKSLIDVAIEGKLEEAMRSGIPSPLIQKDLMRAAKSAIPSTKDWFLKAKNYALYANESGLYDDVLRYLKMK